MKSRPTKQKLKQRGILKERVFGCDLGEHLLNSGFEGKNNIYNLIISVSDLSLLIFCNQVRSSLGKQYLFHLSSIAGIEQPQALT